jgi:hypothetical protein
MAKPPRMTTKMPKPAPQKAVLRRAPLKPVKPVMPVKAPLTRPPLKATAAEAAVIDRANRSQALEDKENRLMRVGTRKAPQVISTTVRERTTPPKKK